MDHLLHGSLAVLSPPLIAHALRPLTIDPAIHPRGQGRLSAASGLVCLNGCAYVIADDENHVTVFRGEQPFGVLHRIRSGDLPASKGARKKRKADFETLFSLPALKGSAALIAFGSGSRPMRYGGVVIPLDINGEPSPRVRHFDLTPLYDPLIGLLSAINIEGAMIVADKLVLAAGQSGDVPRLLPPLGVP